MFKTKQKHWRKDKRLRIIQILYIFPKNQCEKHLGPYFVTQFRCLAALLTDFSWDSLIFWISGWDFAEPKPLWKYKAVSWSTATWWVRRRGWHLPGCVCTSSLCRKGLIQSFLNSKAAFPLTSLGFRSRSQARVTGWLYAVWGAGRRGGWEGVLCHGLDTIMPPKTDVCIAPAVHLAELESMLSLVYPCHLRKATWALALWYHCFSLSIQKGPRLLSHRLQGNLDFLSSEVTAGVHWIHSEFWFLSS